MRSLLFRLLFAERLRTLQERLEFHRVIAPEAIPAVQRDRFNEVWEVACRRYHFYAEWKRRFGLPDRIHDITELRHFPVLRKADLQEHAASIAREAAPCSFTRTGGSTGTPVRHPVTRLDRDLWFANSFVGKSWSGILPGDPTALLWGHAHLLGGGLKRHVMTVRKRLVDYVANTERFSAYHLDDASLQEYAAAIRAIGRPVLIGYSSALRRLMDHVENSGHWRHGDLALKAVVFAAEVCREDDLERARQLFGALALVEYGMAECGPVGYSTPQDSRVRMIWDAVYCHARRDGELVLTTLQRRRFPYINYGSGDLVEGVADEASPVFTCGRILGRVNDTILLTRKDGSTFEANGIVLMEIDELPGVQRYLIHQKGQQITFRVKFSVHQDLAVFREQLLMQITTVVPGLNQDTIAVEALSEEEPKTVAGKTRFIVRE
jgi:phenylacetate-CoA ligase